MSETDVGRIGHWPPRAFLAALLVAASVASSACGYALAGRGNTLPAHIRIIGVPQFTNESRTPDLDQLLTEAVRQELQGRGRYRIVSESSNVDAVLTASIQPLLLTPTEFTSAGASKYTVTVLANVEFVDQKEKKPFWANPVFRVSEDYVVPNVVPTSDASAAFSADKNALDRLARNFARTLVTSILEAF